MVPLYSWFPICRFKQQGVILYYLLLKNKSMCKWTHAVQTLAVQGLTILRYVVLVVPHEENIYAHSLKHICS